MEAGRISTCVDLKNHYHTVIEKHRFVSLQVPLSSFVLTSYAQKAEGQSDMNGERVRWIGISMLGGNSGVEGPFELGIQSIKAVNKEDTHSPCIGECGLSA